MTTFQSGSYVFANVVGFQTSVIRCRVNRVRAEYGILEVTTADLADAGTTLTLDMAKCQPEKETETMAIHRDGLVAFA